MSIISNERAKKALKKRENKAKKYLNNPTKLANFVNNVDYKSHDVSKIRKYVANIKQMTALIRDVINGNYKNIPIGSLVSIIAALIYFLSPIDIIPDVVPIIGYIDDVTIIATCLSYVKDDLNRYIEWRMSSANA